MKVINYIEVPATEEQDINRGKTTWREGKCVMVDEGVHVMLYIGHKTETATRMEGEESVEYERTVAFPVRLAKPLTKAAAVNAAEMQAYALADAAAVASFNASLARKWRENINDKEVSEHDEFIKWVKNELRKTGLFAASESRVDETAPTLSDLVTLGTALARQSDSVLTETQKAKVFRLFPTWDELLKKGEPLPVGTELQDGGEFYRVIQAHTPQADWKPAEQHALYAYVSPHEGTEDDPIPYRHWMLLEAGKYYTEYGVTYKCTQSLGVGYDSDLSGLAAFVTVV